MNTMKSQTPSRGHRSSHSTGSSFDRGVVTFSNPFFIGGCLLFFDTVLAACTCMGFTIYTQAKELSEFEEKARTHQHHKHQKKEHDRGKEIKQLKKTVREKEEALTQLKDEIIELKAAQTEVDGKIARMKVPCVKMLAYDYDAIYEGDDDDWW